MRRGGCFTQAKNTVIFGLSNKRRKAGEGWKQSQLQHISARLVQLSAVCRSSVKALPGFQKQTQFMEGENGSRWYISCVLWSSEKLVNLLSGSSALLTIQWSAVITRNTTGRDVSFRLLATFLLHFHPSVTSQVCHAPSWHSCRHAASSPELKRSPAPWMCTSHGGKTKKKTQGQGEQKGSVGKAKDRIDGGETRGVFMFTACPFDVHSKTTWGPQQPVPVANMTVNLAASVHAWDFTPPLFPPCPMLRSAAVPSLSLCPTTQPFYLTRQGTFGTPGSTPPFLPARLVTVPVVLETTFTPWNWHEFS